MDRQALHIWTMQQRALRVAEIAVTTLDAARVRALPVKGVVLARQVYDPASRPISDIDLVIEPASFRRVLGIARKAGWPLVWDTRLLGSVNVVIEGFAVDVKSSLGPPGLSLVGADRVLARAAWSEQPLGFPHWQIEQHDHALLLAIDAFKDGLGTGKAWAREDLVRIAAMKGFSTSTLVERAASACLQTMLAIVAEWVLSSGVSRAWCSVRDELGAHFLRSAYLVRYRRWLDTRARSRWARLYQSALTRTVSDSFRQRGLAVALSVAGTAKYLVRHRGFDVDAWRAARRL